jgi:hypothetical protein
MDFACRVIKNKVYVIKLLKENLDLHPYKVTTVQELLPHDPESRIICSPDLTSLKFSVFDCLKNEVYKRQKLRDRVSNQKPRPVKCSVPHK